MVKKSVRAKTAGAMDLDAYPVLVRCLAEEDGGGFLASAPDLPGCVSDGETPEQALGNVRDAILAWLSAAREAGDPTPRPSVAGSYCGRWPKRRAMRA